MINFYITSFQDIVSAVPELEITSCSLDTVTAGGVASRGVRGGAKLVLAKPELLDSWPAEHPSIWVKNKEVSLINFLYSKLKFNFFHRFV